VSEPLDLRAGNGFGLANLPYGVFCPPGEPARVGVAVGEHVLDLARVFDGADFAAGTLNSFLARGPVVWAETRQRLLELLTDPGRRDTVAASLHSIYDVRLRMPFEVADYVDFYSSLEHATNLGRILRPDGEPLSANWRHLPIGYHGRAGSVVVSGTPVRRPRGQRREPGQERPGFGPSTRLDVEAEVGFVVGVGSELGEPVPAERFAVHVFGVVLVNDWSARDIQAWEYQPLGPFLGKSFATSISPWVVPLAALQAAKVTPPAQDPPPLPYLVDAAGWGLDLALELRLNGEVVSRPQFAGMYWTPAQQLAHLTVNGANLRTGDLFASGTVSGAQADQRGSLIELTWNGREPLRLSDGSTRSFLLDGDTVAISGSAPGEGGQTVSLGEVVGRILPA
jgi:fumarylacetoacetase